MGWGVVALLAALLTGSSPASAPHAPVITEPVSSSLTKIEPRGAHASASLIIFTLDGTPFPRRISASVSSADRLTLVSPEGITAPSSPTNLCSQDSPTQVSCNPGSIGALAGDLGGGADFLTVDPALRIPIGIQLAGPDSPMLGGTEGDRIVGGSSADLIDGGAGVDSIDGSGSTDIVRGDAGKDRLNGGAGADAIYGEAGADKLNGGAGRDLCSGGGGRDRAKGCTILTKIP